MFSRPVIATIFALALTATACKLTSQPVQPETAPEVVQVSGEELYQQMGCEECHTNGAGIAAPALEGLYGGMVMLDNGETILVIGQGAGERNSSAHEQINWTRNVITSRVHGSG